MTPGRSGPPGSRIGLSLGCGWPADGTAWGRPNHKHSWWRGPVPCWRPFKEMARGCTPAVSHHRPMRARCRRAPRSGARVAADPRLQHRVTGQSAQPAPGRSWRDRTADARPLTRRDPSPDAPRCRRERLSASHAHPARSVRPSAGHRLAIAEAGLPGFLLPADTLMVSAGVLVGAGALHPRVALPGRSHPRRGRRRSGGLPGAGGVLAPACSRAARRRQSPPSASSRPACSSTATGRRRLSCRGSCRWLARSPGSCWRRLHGPSAFPGRQPRRCHGLGRPDVRRRLLARCHSPRLQQPRVDPALDGGHLGPTRPDHAAARPDGPPTTSERHFLNT